MLGFARVGNEMATISKGLTSNERREWAKGNGGAFMVQIWGKSGTKQWYYVSSEAEKRLRRHNAEFSESLKTPKNPKVKWVFAVPKKGHRLKRWYPTAGRGAMQGKGSLKRSAVKWRRAGKEWANVLTVQKWRSKSRLRDRTCKNLSFFSSNYLTKPNIYQSYNACISLNYKGVSGIMIV